MPLSARQNDTCQKHVNEVLVIGEDQALPSFVGVDVAGQYRCRALGAWADLEVCAARPKISSQGTSQKCGIKETERKQACPLRRLGDPGPISHPQFHEAQGAQTVGSCHITCAPECKSFRFTSIREAKRKLNLKLDGTKWKKR